ncbi:unnamed protein product [Ceutorhynchus assimilis]|uniref:RING-type E3 ubiquitin transferase n=1 Tax=Ceutorhynchus assimilis TaxID=467358 RepID=A0A9N9MUJ9_9CUCU|nr:unnamed protein product [Ceutorhynchus assimilis]
MVGKNPKPKKKVERLHYRNLEPSEVVCPVCRTIFVEPVTLPCDHVFCKECFEDTMENVTLGCPLCRNRVGSWVRTAKKADKFINKEFWEAIQSQYAKALRNKYHGFDNDFEKEEPVIIVARPGDIRKEYEKEKNKHLEEQNKSKAEEEMASAALIKNLSEEEAHEKQAKEEQLRKDELLAQKLQEELNAPSTSRRLRPVNANKAGPLDRFIKNQSIKNSKNSPEQKQPKKLFVAERKVMCSSSGDNSDIIDQECRFYFKPIDLNKKYHKPGKVPLKVSAVKGLLTGKKIVRPPSGEKPRIGYGQTAFAWFISGPTRKSVEEVKQKVPTGKELPSTSHQSLKRKSNSFDDTKLPKKRTIVVPSSAKKNDNLPVKRSNTWSQTCHHMTTRRSKASTPSSFLGFDTSEIEESEKISNSIKNIPHSYLKNKQTEDSIKKIKLKQSIDINRNIPKSTNVTLNNSAIDSINGEINGLSPESPVINNFIGKNLIQFNKPSKNPIIFETPPGDFDSSDSEEDVVLSNLIDSFCKSKLEESAPIIPKKAPKKVPLSKAGTSKNVDNDSKAEELCLSKASPEEKKRKRQEIDDFALAKKLQAEFDRIHVLSTTRRGTRRRQVTLDEMLTV